MSALDIFGVLSERGIRIESKPPNLRVFPTNRVGTLETARGFTEGPRELGPDI